MEIFSALVDSTTSEEVLTLLSKELIQLGYVKEGYLEAILEREKSYPTGLSFNDHFQIAVPHANIDLTEKEVMVVVKTRNQTLQFHKMDDPAKIIGVNILFLFAIKESKKYIQFLSDFIEILKNVDFQKKIKEYSPKKTVALLDEVLPKYEFLYKGFLI